jgi:hypothetical protein
MRFILVVQAHFPRAKSLINTIFHEIIRLNYSYYLSSIWIFRMNI